MLHAFSLSGNSKLNPDTVACKQQTLPKQTCMVTHTPVISSHCRAMYLVTRLVVEYVTAVIFVRVPSGGWLQEFLCLK